MRTLTSFEIESVTGGAVRAGCRYVKKTETTENPDGSKTTKTERTLECAVEKT
jgi:hypothetical protein